MSWSTNAPVHESNTSHVLTFHGCNLEQLLVFKALRVDECTSPPVEHLACVDDPRLGGGTGLQMRRNASKWLSMGSIGSKLVNKGPIGSNCLQMSRNGPHWTQNAPNWSKRIQMGPNRIE